MIEAGGQSFRQAGALLQREAQGLGFEFASGISNDRKLPHAANLEPSRFVRTEPKSPGCPCAESSPAYGWAEECVRDYPVRVAAGSIEQIIAALEAARVRYLVVGGVAVVLHGHPRFTADLDLVLGLDLENVKAALGALRRLGYAPRAPVAAEDLADPERRAEWIRDKGMTVFSLASPEHLATNVDLFVEEPFVFEEAYARAAEADLGDIVARVVSISDLVAMKRRSARPQDLEDVAQLEAIARLTEQDADG